MLESCSPTWGLICAACRLYADTNTPSLPRFGHKVNHHNYNALPSVGSSKLMSATPS
eukprot:NODE_174_length_3465_cov_13.189035.p13 GENE.NODE_174_length_3465_cov_13.189035~~NODE_174_length_3465_cov_13.189035.p13  ORF type:complete len:57 (+),score=1.54 NODE_174_length_3465_cov_13.189035:2240-2410(+)